MNRRGFITGLISGLFGCLFVKKITPPVFTEKVTLPIRGKVAYFIIVDDPYIPEELDITKFKEELEKYSNGLQRYSVLQGVEVKPHG